MGNLRLFVALAVLCAVFGSICAQNRGSSRYVPSAEEYDGESTRAPRVASARGTAVRRQRPPTPAPEPSETDDAPRSYQTRQTPSREGTTGRRVASRVSSQQSPQQYSPPPPPEPHIPELPAPLSPVDDLPPSPPVAPEGRPQGKRRRTKKRKRPQGAIPKPVDETEKLNIEIPEKTKAPLPELLAVEPKAPQTFETNPENILPPNFVSPTEYKDNAYNRYSDGLENSPRGDSAPSQYYPPQAGTNRLPVETSEEIQSSRRYPEPTPVNRDVPNRRYVPPSPVVDQPTRGSYIPPAVDAPIRGSYVPPAVDAPTRGSYVPPAVDAPTRGSYVPPAIDAPTRGSYVPVLQPVRATAEASSRLPASDFNKERTSDSARDRSSNYRSPQRTPSNLPVADPSEIIRNSGASPPQNNIFRNDQEDVPNRGHSEVRLPQPEDLPIPGDKSFGDNPSYDSAEEVLNRFEEDIRSIEENAGREAPSPINRLPNPTESEYDASYLSYLDDESEREPSRNAIPRQNQDTLPPPPPPPASSRSAVPSRGSARRGAETPSKDTNEGDSARRQISRYEPPLQRTSSRYTPDGSESSSRSGAPLPEVPATRSRSSSRNRVEADAEPSVRTRGSSRYQPESSIDTPTRTRGTQPPESTPQSSRSRNSQRYRPEPIESDSRVAPRRQPANQVVRQPVPEPIEEDIPLQYAPEPADEYDPNPVRHTMRARPQFDAPQPYEESLYEEPLNDERPPPTAYVPEYQAPRQQDRREPNQRTPPAREQSSRQQNNRRDNVDHRSAAREPQPHSRAPQRDTRTQYEAPRREPSPPRQQQPTPRQQPRARQPEPSSAPSRARSSSKFNCPEPYGFFADPVQCDRYYECRNGTAIDSLCEDGLAFNEASAPKYLRCDSLRDVDCAKRPELQEARPTKNCPRRFGLFPHETDCTKFWNCVDGTSTEVQCPPGLTYNDDRATCDWADLVQTSCKTEDLLGFTCPEANPHDLQDGVYTSYPHPDNCQLHFVCIKGTDGERRPRLLSCNEGLVYSTESSSCTRPENVPGCEDFFPAPKRKPSREPEELEEEPKPRRTQTRRTRN